MKTYHCSCGQLIFFHNTSCVNCGHELGFFPDSLTLADMEPAEGSIFRPNFTQATANGRLYKKCANYVNESVCNWMIPADEASERLCTACRLNEIIPDLTVPGNRENWARIESAKQHLIYSLLRMKLPIANKLHDPEQGLAFRFLADATAPDGTLQKVVTGHDHGTITLNIDEANDSVREKKRHSMNEPYRTLLGHFRHEIGHYYWDQLVAGTQFQRKFCELFGDERADYAKALEAHYANGAPSDWQTQYISAYASSHPWEDWAETWAHVLHAQDTMEVAADFGLVGKKWHISPRSKSSKAEAVPAPAPSAFDAFVTSWSELTIALNSINRAMGQQDIYPFVLSAPVIEKLRFVSEVIASASTSVAVPRPRQFAPADPPYPEFANRKRSFEVTEPLLSQQAQQMPSS